MKKIISVMMVMMLTFAFPSQVSAEESPTLESIADSIIEITTDNTNENPTTTYNNIEEFVNEVRNQIPDIDDLELANFIMDYTGQDDLEVADEETLKYLGYKEIIVSEDYIRVDEAGNTESMTQDEMTLAMFRDDYGISPLQNPWTSDNGYMQIKIVISRETGILSNKKVGYQIAVYGKWLKNPVCFFEDVLTLYFSEGNYDTTHEVYGKLEETFTCCSSKSNYKSQVWKNANKPDYYTNKNVKVDNTVGNVQAIRFNLKNITTFQCTRTTHAHTQSVSNILAYMSYGIKVPSKEDCIVQGVYGHKKISVGSIGISASQSGVSLSLSPSISLNEYRGDKVGFTAI